MQSGVMRGILCVEHLEIRSLRCGGGLESEGAIGAVFKAV